MVILNKNEEEIVLNTEKYAECLNGSSYAVDVLSGKIITSLNELKINSESPLILELFE